MDLNRHFTLRGRLLVEKIQNFFEWGYESFDDFGNNGVLSEYILIMAINSAAKPTDGKQLSIYTADGLSVVTSSATYKQSADEEHPDRISFSCVPRAKRDPNPDIFMFCLFKSYGSSYDPVELSNWEFFFVPGDTIRSFGKKTITLNSLLGLNPVKADYEGIADTLHSFQEARP